METDSAEPASPPGHADSQGFSAVAARPYTIGNTRLALGSYEEVYYTAGGNIYGGTFMDYLLPTAV